MVIEKTNITYKKTIRKQRNISAVAIFSFLLIAVIMIVTVKRKPLESFQGTIKKDSIINVLQKEVLKQEQKTKELQASNLSRQRTTYKYTVKNGDNLSKLAYIFYNDWQEHTRIEKDNNLRSDELIYPGDTLVITLND